jgi:hypothetical protein
MSWQQLSARGEVKAHQTSKRELDNIRALIARDLADAGLTGLSADRRFATAYNAALQAGKITIACSGYRVGARAGHHAVTFEAVRLAIGTEASFLVDYFDTCRRKRNLIDYDNSSVATQTEADELQLKAAEFLALVEAWVVANYPAFAR